MCAAPILAADAWTDADAEWERQQVAAGEAVAAGDLARAATAWAAALRVARASFAADDPRLATSLANHATALREKGEPVPARLWGEALEILDEAPAWVARQRFGRGARSSVFHLRLETKHPGAYDTNLRRRAETLLGAARAATATLAAGARGRAPDRAALRAIRSARPGAMRKVLAAAHLLVAPPGQDSQPRPDQDGS